MLSSVNTLRDVALNVIQIEVKHIQSVNKLRPPEKLTFCSLGQMSILRNVRRVLATSWHSNTTSV